MKTLRNCEYLRGWNFLLELITSFNKYIVMTVIYYNKDKKPIIFASVAANFGYNWLKKR